MKKSTHLARAVAALAVIGASVFAAAPANALTVGSTVVTFLASSDVEYSATSPDGTKFAYAYYDAGEVVIFDTVTQTATTVDETVLSINRPGGVVFKPDGSKIFVADYSNGNVMVVDVATAAVVGSLESGDYWRPWSINVSPDGTKVFVGDYSYNSIVTYDLASDSTTTIQSVNDSYGMYISQDGSTLFNVDYDGNIDVMNLSTGLITDSWTTVTGSFSNSCVNSDVTVLYLPDYAGGSLYKVSLADGSVLDSIALDNAAIEGRHSTCTVSPDDSAVYLTDYYTGGVEADVTIVSSPGVFYEYSTAPLAYVAKYATSGVAYTQQINFSDDCSGWVAGYYGNAQQLSLDGAACSSAPSTPELPNTGVDMTAMSLAGGVALAVLGLGTVLVVVRRRTA